MGIKNTALEMISLVEIFSLEKNIFPPIFGLIFGLYPMKFYDTISFM